ncbi:MAG: CsgG/HfaB family protein [Phycisphaerae bacterium]
MRSRRRVCGSLLWVLLLLVVLVGGCSKKMWITQYPSWYSSELKTIAVVPFRNTTSVKGAGEAVSEQLARAMMANGTYEVVSQSDVAAMSEQVDLMLYARSGDAAAAAEKFSTLQRVQAILVGTVTTYAATTQRQHKREPVYAYNSRTKQQYIAGYREYDHVRNEANVAVTAALIRVPGGDTIHATAGPVGATDYSESDSDGSAPDRDPYACLANAAHQTVAGLVREFAVTRREIEVGPDDFRTAQELYENKWDYADKFTADDDQAYLVLALPACCDRNRFRLTIVRKDQREYLYEHEFAWDAKYGRFGYGFSPREIAAAGGGPGRYVAKFYSGPEPVLEHTFTIEPVR